MQVPHSFIVNYTHSLVGGVGGRGNLHGHQRDNETTVRAHLYTRFQNWNYRLANETTLRENSIPKKDEKGQFVYRVNWTLSAVSWLAVFLLLFLFCLAVPCLSTSSPFVLSIWTISSKAK